MMIGAGHVNGAQLDPLTAAVCTLPEIKSMTDELFEASLKSINEALVPGGWLVAFDDFVSREYAGTAHARVTDAPVASSTRAIASPTSRAGLPWHAPRRACENRSRPRRRRG